MSGAMAAQLVIATLPIAAYQSYSLVAIFLCLSFLPLSDDASCPTCFTRCPALASSFGIHHFTACRHRRYNVGATGAALRMVGPLFAFDNQLSSGGIGLFLLLFILGGALAQFPVGLLADKTSKRQVMLALSLVTIVTALIMQWGALSQFFGGKPDFCYDLYLWHGNHADLLARCHPCQ